MRLSPILQQLLPLSLLACAQQRSAPEAAPDASVVLCGPGTVITPVGWTEHTALGVSPREAFGATLACEARVKWDASWLPEFQVEPVAGDTTLTIRAAPGERAAELVSPPPDNPNACRPFLRMDADLSVEMAEGVLAGSERTVLYYRPRSAVSTSFRISMDGSAAGSLRMADPRGFFLDYSARWGEHGCMGSISLATTLAGVQSSWSLGAWSNTACWDRGAPIPIDDADAPADVDALVRVFDGVFPGQWQGGEPTQLHLEVTRNGDFLCRSRQSSETVFTVPVRIRYSTTDGRVATSQAEGFVSLSSGADHRVLTVAEHFVCSGVGESSAYASCGDISHARVHVDLTYDSGQVGPSFQPALRVYEYRGPDPVPARSLELELDE